MSGTKNRKFLVVATLTLACITPAVNAEGWCDVQPGWTVVTHGTLADNVFILGRLQGGGDIWMIIANSTIGKGNVAVALAAQASGKSITVYLDSPSYTCANFPSWAPAGGIRHIRLNN